jgi:4-amino-4-deoxy-L-arabinose transferase-like glycosyltransferase
MTLLYERLRRSLRAAGWPGCALVLVLVVALGLRLQGIGWGLPYNFVNPDEGTVVPKAVHIALGYLNPEFFYYPSFFFYLLAGAYWVVAPFWWLFTGDWIVSQGAFVVDSGPHVLIARLLVVCLGTVSIYLVYRLGAAAYGRWTGLLAAVFVAVEPLHAKYSHMAVTDVPAMAISLLALLLLLNAAQGRPRRLLWGAVAAGLATSTKYNLGMLVLPATVAGLYAVQPAVRTLGLRGMIALRARVRVLVRRVYLPMLLAFVAGSPYVLVDLPHFVHDFLRQGHIVKRGWLGFEQIGNTYWYNFSVNLAGALGLVLLALALGGVALAFWRRTRFDLMVAPYLVVTFLYVSSWKELADRYVLPLVPLLLLLGARLCVTALGRRPAARRHVVRALRPALTSALAVTVIAAAALPLSDSIAYNRSLAGQDVRLTAKDWVERNIPIGSLIAVDTYGPPLVRRMDMPYFRQAGMTPAYYGLLKLKLPVPGVRDERHSLRFLRRRGVDYVIVTSAVYKRIMAAATEYPRVVSFYRRLGDQARLLRVFRPKPGERGPVIKLYRLTGTELSRR